MITVLSDGTGQTFINLNIRDLPLLSPEVLSKLVNVPHILLWKVLAAIPIEVLALDGVVAEVDRLVAVGQVELLRAEPQVALPVYKHTHTHVHTHVSYLVVVVHIHTQLRQRFCIILICIVTRNFHFAFIIARVNVEA